MKILEQIAQDLVDKTSEILNYPISITDNRGYIIGASDKSRIGTLHQPSLGVFEKSKIDVYKGGIDQKVLPGACLPIEYNNQVIGVLGIIGGEPGEVNKYAELTKNHIEMMCQEALRKEMVELKDKMMEIFVHQIIHPKENEGDEHIRQYAELLDINLNVNCICLLIDIDDFNGKINSKTKKKNRLEDFPYQYFQREVLDYLNLILRESEDDIISSLNIRSFIIIKSLSSEHSYSYFVDGLRFQLDKLNSFLDRKYQISASIAVGDISFGMKGISTSYHNAKKAMDNKIGWNDDTHIHVYNEREIMLQLLAKELTTDYKEKLANMLLPLLTHDNYEVLSSTFIAYCNNNMILSETSRNIYVHRNTLIYRLEKIQEITSFNTGNFRHCMLLYNAIICHEDTKKSVDMATAFP